MKYGVRGLDYDYTVQDIKNVHFKIGSKVNVKTKIDKSMFDFVGTVVADYPFFIIIDTGHYNMAVNKVDLVYKYGATSVKEVV